MNDDYEELNTNYRPTSEGGTVPDPELQARLLTISQSIVAMQNTMVRLGTDLTSLKNTMTGTSNATLNTKLANIDVSISTLQQVQSSLNARVRALESPLWQPGNTYPNVYVIANDQRIPLVSNDGQTNYDQNPLEKVNLSREQWQPATISDSVFWAQDAAHLYRLNQRVHFVDSAANEVRAYIVVDDSSIANLLINPTAATSPAYMRYVL